MDNIPRFDARKKASPPLHHPKTTQPKSILVFYLKTSINYKLIQLIITSYLFFNVSKVPKVCNRHILFVSSATLGTFTSFMQYF